MSGFGERGLLTTVTISTEDKVVLSKNIPIHYNNDVKCKEALILTVQNIITKQN